MIVDATISEGLHATVWRRSTTTHIGELGPAGSSQRQPYLDRYSRPVTLWISTLDFHAGFSRQQNPSIGGLVGLLA